MSAVSKFLEKKYLKSLELLNALSSDKLDDIIRQSTVENLPAGRTLFRQGEKDSNVLYLLSGQIELLTSGAASKSKVLKAKSDEARSPIANATPRPCTARTKTASSILYIDASLLEILLDDNQSGEYEVTEIGVSDEATDWMMKFLQSRAFLSIPTDNIQSLLMRMEEVPVKAGQKIIKQGDKGDYYYVVKQGTCAVSRRPIPTSEEVRLAELSIGNGFGEEALITDGKRSANVTMLEDGILMRLSKEDFKSILFKPLMQYIDIGTVINKKNPTMSIIDVRQKKDFENNSFPHSVNIPLSMLRLRIPTLDLNREYLSYCDNGKESAAAAFLLNQHGFNCKIIEGQLAKLESQPVKEMARKKSIPAPVPVARKKTEDNKVVPLPKKEDKPARKTPEVKKETLSSVEKLREAANKIHQQADNLVHKTDHHDTNSRTDIKQPTSTPTNNPKVTRKPSASKPTTASVTSTPVIDPVLTAKKESARILTEANKVKQAALEEAARLKKEIEANVTNIEARETARLKKQLEETRKRAEASIEQNKKLAEDMRQQAEQERAQIIAQAKREAEELKNEISQLRQQANLEQQGIKKQIESEILAAKQRVREEAKRIAEEEANQEGEQIIQQARLEAEQLKQEIELLRAKADEEQREIRQKLQQEVEQAKQQAAEEARIAAEAEAKAIREKALKETQKINDDIQKTKKLLKEQTNRARKITTISHEDVFTLDEELAAAPVEVSIADEKAAELLAKQIKQKLNETEQQRQSEEARHKETKSTIKKLKDRTILESDSDVFIFKFPSKSVEPKQPEPIKQQSAQENISNIFLQEQDDVLLIQLPDPVEQAADEPVKIESTDSPSGFNLVLDNNIENARYAYPQAKKKKSFIAAAASVLLIIALSSVAYTTKIQLNFTEVSAIDGENLPAKPGTIAAAEEKVRYEAELEFKRKLAGLK